MIYSDEITERLSVLRDKYGAEAVLSAIMETHDVDRDGFSEWISRYGADTTLDRLFGLSQEFEERVPGTVQPAEVAPTGATPEPMLHPEGPSPRPATGTGAPIQLEPAIEAQPAPREEAVTEPPSGAIRVALPKTLDREAPLKKRLTSLAKAGGLDLSTLMAVIKKESKFDIMAKGAAGELGLIQLMPRTAEQVGLRVDKKVDERGNPIRNLEGGMLYMAWLRKHFGAKTIQEVLAGYNAGPKALKTKKVPSSTKTYIKVVSDYAKEYKRNPKLLEADIEKLVQSIAEVGI